MVWQPELDELAHRRELAHRMGGAENIERQRRGGKLTIRERIDRLLDGGSFREKDLRLNHATLQRTADELAKLDMMKPLQVKSYIDESIIIEAAKRLDR